MATRVAVATMKVAQIPKAGADFEIVEREIPEPGVGHVRIKVQACGVKNYLPRVDELAWCRTLEDNYIARRQTEDSGYLCF
jgi:hypothetical protein